MQDAFVDEISAEERAIQMGEAPPEEKPKEEVKPTEEGTGTLEAEKPVQETEKPAETATATETKTEQDKPKEGELTPEEQQAATEEGYKLETDKKGRQYLVNADERIPVERFKKVYGQSKATQQELTELKEERDLIKRMGLDAYYKAFPDKAPEGYKPPEPERKATPVPSNFDPLNLPVKGGNYDGYTLREVMQVDPDEARRLYDGWIGQQIAVSRQEEERVSRTQKEQVSAAKSFGDARAKELFGVQDVDQLPADQQRKILLIGNEVLDWQTKNNCLHYSFEDAYRLKNYEDRIKQAEERGAANAIKGLQKAGPASINTAAGGDVKPTGWEAVSKMTEKELDAHLDTLDDAAHSKFLKEAPASIRAKYPSMPWK